MWLQSVHRFTESVAFPKGHAEDDRERLARLLRYLMRSPVSFKRLKYDERTGKVTMRLKRDQVKVFANEVLRLRITLSTSWPLWPGMYPVRASRRSLMRVTTQTPRVTYPQRQTEPKRKKNKRSTWGLTDAGTFLGISSFFGAGPWTQNCVLAVESEWKETSRYTSSRPFPSCSRA